VQVSGEHRGTVNRVFSLFLILDNILANQYNTITILLRLTVYQI
jgi:hypothetical protein